MSYDPEWERPQPPKRADDNSSTTSDIAGRAKALKRRKRPVLSLSSEAAEAMENESSLDQSKKSCRGLFCGLFSGGKRRTKKRRKKRRTKSRRKTKRRRKSRRRTKRRRRKR